MSVLSAILIGLVMGLLFGLALEKSRVMEPGFLIGQFQMSNFTMIKVMLTAIVVGMVGIFTLRHFAKVNLHVRPTRVGANMIGGLLFGAGFH